MDQARIRFNGSYPSLTSVPFSALTLLTAWTEDHPACKLKPAPIIAKVSHMGYGYQSAVSLEKEGQLTKKLKAVDI